MFDRYNKIDHEDTWNGIEKFENYLSNVDQTVDHIEVKKKPSMINSYKIICYISLSFHPPHKKRVYDSN